MPRASVAERIQHYNRDREPERLAFKYAVLRRSAFTFLRGTSHLFHEDWPAGSTLDQTPLTWITGDLHIENFGTYKGDNRLGYFDLNDFDEAMLAPCGRDLARFHTSVLVAARSLGVTERDAATLVRHFVTAYRAALKEGKARWLERQTAEGMVGQLLEDVRHLTRKRLLDRRTKRVGRSRRLRLGKRALPVTLADRQKVERLIERFATREPDPAFYRVLDVARRVAGTASLGLERWVVLVEGRGAPDRLALLDLKEAIPPSMRRFANSSVAWRSEAERVVSIQRWAQAVPPALLHPVRSGGRSYVLRELQPTQNRLSLESCNGKLGPLEGVMVTLGQAVAWSHLRSGGRQGSAIADQWIAFAEDKAWSPALYEFASSYSRQVERDWQEFSEDGAVTDQ
jgi:uncharacterized protein (DUF2252 family)